MLHRDKDYQMPFADGLNIGIIIPGWRPSAYCKNRKIAISPQRFDRSPRNLARWSSSTLLGVPIFKIKKN